MNRNSKDEISFHIMLAPGMILLIMFSIMPMFGIVMAFQNYIPTRGILNSKWVGLDNILYLFQLTESVQAIKNTVIIAIAKILASLFFPLLFALSLNAVRTQKIKKASQTIVYLPFFLSWVILASTLQNILDLHGPINQALANLGADKVQFLVSNKWFRPILIITDTWKNLGYNTVIYLAAIVGIDPSLYEAAAVDGAGRWKRIWHVTLPGMKPTIVILFIMRLGHLLGSGFDRLYAFGNVNVRELQYQLSIYVFERGLEGGNFSRATAVGLFQALVAVMLVIMADRFVKLLGEDGLL